MRYTKKDIVGMFQRFIKSLQRHGEITDNLHLDYAACYGGYVIGKYGENGSVSHPYGSERRTAKEMYNSLYTITEILEKIGEK